MSTVLATPISKPEKTKNKSKSKDHSKSRPKDKGKHKEHAHPSFANILQDDFSSDEEDLPPPNEALVPPGSTLLTEVADGDAFDWDTVRNNEDLEIWVVRVPDGVKPKHLSHLSLSVPPSQAKTSQKVGSLSKKNGPSYDVWSILPSSSAPTSDSNDDYEVEGDVIGGEELLGMNVLLPRKKKGGRLFIAPKPVTQHLVLAAQPSLPTPPPSPDSSEQTTTNANANANANANTATTSEIAYKSPARYQHPKHLLKHRFVPTGAGLHVPPPSIPVLAPAPPIESVEKEDKRDFETTKSTAHTHKQKQENEAAHMKDKEHKHKHKEKKEKEQVKDAVAKKDETPKKRKAEGEGKKAKRPKTES